MRTSALLSSLLASGALAFPSLKSLDDERLPAGFSDNAVLGLKAMKRDPELVHLMQTLYAQQMKEKDNFFAGNNVDLEDVSSYDPYLEKRTTSSCLAHPLNDFYPTNTTGLKKFPEAAYPYQDPKPSDQRGPCPGMANSHG